MESVILGWFAFWATYWFCAELFPYNKLNRLELKNKHPVEFIVFRNMMVSLPFGYIASLILPDLSPLIYDVYLVKFFICIIIADGWFYLMHRLLHQPWFYIRFHKKHHEYNHPFPLVAVYSTLFEALLCDTMAIGLGPYLLRLSGMELQLYMALMALHSLSIHSDLPIGREHNEHHGKNMGNFGLFSVFDLIFGTFR